MKHTLSILTAAAVTVASMIRQITESHVFSPPDESAVYLPQMSTELVHRYLQSGATDQEIADCFLVDVSLIQQRYGPLIKSTRAYQHMVLRSLQMQGAKKLSPSVLIFLGKNYLGQSNSPGKAEVAEPEIDE